MKNPREILTAWMQAVNARDIEALVGLYNPAATLMPTFSNKLLNTPAKIREYFVKLAERDTLSVSLHEKTLKIQPVTGEVFVAAGMYYWQLSMDGELLGFESRFSYVLDVSQPAPIVHHHSSQIPRML